MDFKLRQLFLIIDGQELNYVITSLQTYHTTADKTSSQAAPKSLSVQGEIDINIYERKDGNILDVESLKIIWEIEDKMLNTPGYPDFCYKPDLEGLPEQIQTLLLENINSTTKCNNFQSFIVYLKQVVAAFT